MVKTMEVIESVCKDEDCVKLMKELIERGNYKNTKKNSANAAASITCDDVKAYLLCEISTEDFNRMEMEITSKRPDLAMLFSEPKSMSDKSSNVREMMSTIKQELVANKVQPCLSYSHHSKENDKKQEKRSSSLKEEEIKTPLCKSNFKDITGDDDDADDDRVYDCGVDDYNPDDDDDPVANDNDGVEDSLDGGVEDSLYGGVEESLDVEVEDSLHGGVEDSLDVEVEDSLYGGVEDSLHGGVEDSLDVEVEDSLYGEVEGSLDVGVEDSLHGGVEDSLHGGVEDSLHGGVEDSLHGEVEDSLDVGVEDSLHGGVEDSLDCGVDFRIHAGADDRVYMYGGIDDDYNPNNIDDDDPIVGDDQNVDNNENLLDLDDIIRLLIPFSKTCINEAL